MTASLPDPAHATDYALGAEIVSYSPASGFLVKFTGDATAIALAKNDLEGIAPSMRGAVAEVDGGVTVVFPHRDGLSGALRKLQQPSNGYMTESHKFTLNPPAPALMRAAAGLSEPSRA